jgi:hypothetical protein
MPQDLGYKRLKLKRGDIRARTKDDLTAVVWRDKRDVHILTNIHNPPVEGNFCDEHGNTIKPYIVEQYNRHMGYVDKGGRMANSYSISRRTWKWTKKLFFHLLDLTVLNSYLLFSSISDKKLSHRHFRMCLVRNLVAHAGSQPHPHKPLGRPPHASTKVSRWTQVATSIGLSHQSLYGVACVHLVELQEK